MEALSINLPEAVIVSLKTNFHYQWRDSSLKYLGIYLTPTYSSLYSHNYPRLFTEIRRLHKWNNLPLSLFGRISSVKMTIRPKLLYLFEILPMPIPIRELRSIQASVLHFIWAHKRHRIPKSVMMSSKGTRGLAVPEYWSTQLRRIPAWTTLYAYSKWMEIEKLWLAGFNPFEFSSVVYLSY